ncbi:condensation domain-containing protein [Kitasatospora sp. NBC_01287]|uniref:condensation domain-containing protein n=1 Tax=Kitasatospora sp. NBC_01287 TaxID=2903573 RepID=UPI00224E0FFB|nr:condensation domain-containing protein [Kitasatospora sp. NBC_01287]MCX4743982.1 condensation domain-containing protein [Kitasatospora sp. NBC_01287]
MTTTEDTRPAPRGADPDGDRKRLLRLMRARKGLAVSSGGDELRRDPEGPAVTAFSQQSLWNGMRGATTHPVWRMCQGIGLRGPLDLPALQAALDAIVARHEVLRTRYLPGGQDGAPPVPVVAEPCAFPLRVAHAVESVDPASVLEELVSQETRRPLGADGTRPLGADGAPVIRGSLLRLSDEEHLLLVAAHRMAYDGWSRGVLLRELGTFYSPGAAPVAPAPLPVQYGDFARWQRARYSGEDAEEGVAYWTRRLAGAPSTLGLPTDLPRPAVRNHAGDGLPVIIDAELTEALGRLARERGATLFMVLHTAWAILLARLTGERDIVVGTPVANRQRTEVEGLLGYFANVAALRTTVDGELTVRGLIDQVKEMILAGHPHQGVPFGAVVRAMAEASPSGRWDTPALQIMINLVNTPLGAVTSHGLTFSPLVTAPRATEYEVSLIFAEREGGLAGGVVYAAELFSRATIARWIDQYTDVLRRMTAAPDDPVATLLAPAP